MKEAIRIFLVGEQEIVRQGLRHMLEPEEDIEVIGDCANVEEAIPEIASLQPDIVLMDTRMPVTSVVKGIRSLRVSGLGPGVDIIILADSLDYRAEALEAGATSYLLKDIARAELVQAIRQVYLNRCLLQQRNGVVEEAVELVIPPPAKAAWLLRFMCQLAEMFHDNFSSVVCTMGSWDCGAVITIRSQRTTADSLLTKLANMPEVEKVEEQSVAKDAFAGLPKKFGFRPRLETCPSKRLLVTLRETDMPKQEPVSV